MKSRATDSDIQGISPGFAQIVSSMGGSAPLVDAIQWAARGQSFSDRFQRDYVWAIARRTALIAVLLPVIVELFRDLFQGAGSGDPFRTLIRTRPTDRGRSTSIA